MDSKETTLKRVKEVGLLAVMRGPSAGLTLQMVDALVAGGIRGIEITSSTPQAEAVTAALKQKYGDSLLLGMGTLTRVEQVEAAIAAGAGFLVSPVCTPELVTAMAATGRLCMAGAFTPTEVFQAYSLGADVVKIFPGSLGGPAYLKALRGPFPYIPLMPTGGVSEANIAEWLAAGAVALGAGSELCPPQLALEGRFEEITRRAESFVRRLEQARAGQS